MDRGAWRAAVYGVAILRPSPVGVHGEGACVQCRLPRYTLGQPMCRQQERCIKGEAGVKAEVALTDYSQ